MSEPTKVWGKNCAKLLAWSVSGPASQRPTDTQTQSNIVVSCILYIRWGDKDVQLACERSGVWCSWLSHRVCNSGVRGSIPRSSTLFFFTVSVYTSCCHFSAVSVSVMQAI